MKVLPQIEHLNGIVTVTLTAKFVGDPTDATDQQRILAYGDPKVNLAGLFSDPVNPTFQFLFPANECFVGITTEMQNYPASFMVALPATPPSTLTYANPYGGRGCNPYPGPFTFAPCNVTNFSQQQGPLTCVVSDPVRAATIWAAAIDQAVANAMAALRLKTPAQLTTLPDFTA